MLAHKISIQAESKSSAAGDRRVDGAVWAKAIHAFQARTLSFAPSISSPSSSLPLHLLLFLQKEEEPWLARSLKPENFLPGLLIGFLVGLFFDLSASRSRNHPKPKSSYRANKDRSVAEGVSPSPSGLGEELKMVLVVRQDLKMSVGKIASQCAHAATGLYVDLLQSHRSLLRAWEQYGQAKIVLSCKNQQEMNKLKEIADHCGLPTFVVADAGRTQVLAGSRTVLAIGPGRKADIDSVTGKLRLL